MKKYIMLFKPEALQLDTSAEYKCMFALIEVADYETNEVWFTTKTRKEMCKNLKVTNNYLSVLIRKLKEKNILRGFRNHYLINPEYFWKGSLDQRDKYLIIYKEE